MDVPIHSAALIEPEHDALLLTIETTALTCARRLVGKYAAGDVAHDVVLQCLVRIRKGSWVVAPSDLTRSVRRMVLSKYVDEFRGCERRDERGLQHVREFEDVGQAWMTPDWITEERELEKLLERALADLPEACRRAYLLVREGASYKTVAKLLGISKSAVSKHVVTAQHRLRIVLLASGIAPRPARRGGASRRVRPLQGHLPAGLS